MLPLKDPSVEPAPRDRRLNLFRHLRKPQARSLRLATHTTRRQYSRQNTWIHLHQSRNPIIYVLTTTRRYVLSALNHHTAVTQAPLRTAVTIRYEEDMLHKTSLVRIEHEVDEMYDLQYYEVVEDSLMVRYKRRVLGRYLPQ